MSLLNVISYSGGADSTALLVYCRENNIPYGEVIYVEDWFPYPDKEEWNIYFAYIENEFNIKITRLICDKKYWIKREGGKPPSTKIHWCCRVKSEIFANYLKEKYGRNGINIFMGVRKYESPRRSHYTWKGDWYWNKRFSTHYTYQYLIFDFLDTKQYCNIHGVKINPLYEKYGVKRLGCYKCYKVGDFVKKKLPEDQLLLEEWM